MRPDVYVTASFCCPKCQNELKTINLDGKFKTPNEKHIEPGSKLKCDALLCDDSVEYEVPQFAVQVG
jgi:hypothetical protein